MNYYERHIGDYIKKTAHLSLLEHGVYTRLLDVYYDREAPLPDEKVARLVGARTEPETQALQVVLQEFFELRDGAWVNSRCDEEIAAFVEGEPEREVKKANEDNRLKRHRQERAELFKVLVSAGKHAPWNTGMTELRALVSALQVPGPDTGPAMPPATATATPATATQTPVPNTQIYPSSLRSEGGAAKSPPPPPAIRKQREQVTLTAYLALCKASGVKPVPDDHAIRKWCDDANISAEMLQVAWVLFRERYTEGEKGKGKRYKDWAGHFATAVKANWFKLWFVGEGGLAWTSTGLTHKAALDARLAQKEAAHG